MRRAAGILLYFAFLAAFVEVSLHLYYRATSGQWLWARAAVPIYQGDPAAGVWNRASLDFEHRTNEFRARNVTNAEGLRVGRPGIEFARPKPPGTLRVLLLGASFAFGWGVDYEQSFAGQLEAMLRETGFAGKRRLEFLNAGVPSLPAAAQLAWFRAQGRTYQSDIVLQLAYGSLAVPAQQARLSVDADGYVVRNDYTRANRLRDQAKRSATVFYGWMLSTRLRGARGVQGAGREMQNARAFSPDAPEVVASFTHYEALREAAQASGARLVILYFPLSYVVHPQDIARWRHLGVSDPEAQVAFDEAMSEELQRRGFECTNGTQALRSAASDSDERLYYWLDIHWTARGSQVAAQHVRDYLLAGGGRGPPSAGRR